MDNKLIIVGNGCGVLSKENGNLIDSYDYVFRLGSYQLEGFEKFVGSKTDFCVTAPWKLNYDRLNSVKTIITVPIITPKPTDDELNQIFNEIKSKCNQNQLDNIYYFLKRSDIDFFNNIYSDFNNLILNRGIEINPSLGFRSLFLIQKLFNKFEIHVTGFDFFKTGWYWKPDHNRNVMNRHPYIYEKAIYKKLIKDGKLIEL